MKKMTKTGKTLLLSCLALSAFGSIAAGSTYALFTSEAKTDVSVTTGKVSVSTEVSLVDAKTLDNGEEVNATIENNSVTFGAGGKAEVSEDGNVTLSNIVSGDKVSVQVKAKNSSSVNIKYRLVVESELGDNEIISLEGKDGNGNALLVSENGLFSKYKSVEAVANSSDLETYTITIGIDKDVDVTDGTSTTGKVSIKLEAVQGNAGTTDLQTYTKVANQEQLKAALEADDDNDAKIEVASTLELTETLEVSNKNVELVLNNNIVAPTGDSAIVASNGKTVTISGETTASGVQGLKRANVSKPTITCSTDKKTTIVASGEGSKVIIDGVKIVSTKGNCVSAIEGAEVIINDAEVEAQEVCVLAHEAGKITINDGTFTSKDNFVIGTNGKKDFGNNEITINGGTFNGNISSSGYIACGIYVANSDTVSVNAGTFNITNGCGILARAGITTVKDAVKFNFSNTENDIVKGVVGDKSCEVPVNAKIVKDVSNPSYPGGTPIVDATNVVELTQTNANVYLVSTESELTAALARQTEDDATATYVYVKNTIDLTKAIQIKNKDTFIYGDGNVQLHGANIARVINVFASEEYGDCPWLKDGSLNISGVNLKADVDNGTSARGINLYSTTNYTLNLDDADVTAGHYAIYDYLNDGLTVNVKDSTISAYGCFYNYTDENSTLSSDTVATFDNCVLYGRNDYGKLDSNNFANIYIGNGSKETQTENNKLLFNDCTFVMYSKNGNKQRIISCETLGNTVTMNNCSFIAKTDEGETKIEESDLTSYLNTASNVTINGKTY